MSCWSGLRGLLRVLFVSGVAAGAAIAAPSGPSRWVPFGPDGGDARRIVADPHDPSHLYLGTATGWLYASHNAGNSWTRLAQVGKREDLVIDSIVVDAQNPKHLVVGAWVTDRPDGGVYFTYDGGTTWTNQAEMRGQSVRSMAVSLSDPETLVAGTLQGVFRSTDGGKRWERISPEDSKEIHEVQSVAIDPVDPKIIYAGTWHLPWKTTDAGEHWENIKQGIIEDSDVFSIIVDPLKPETVFASACSGIYKSLNAGTRFEKVSGIPNTARRTRRLLQDPTHLETVFAGTTEGLYRSNDAGKTWSRLTGSEIIVNDVEVDAADPKRVLIATDRGGVLASDDGGDSFHPSNGGFSARQVTTLKRDARRPETIFVGVINDKDWGGVFESDNGGRNWIQRSDGLEGRDVFALGQAPDGTMVAGTSHGLFRLDATAEYWMRVAGAPGTPVKKESVSAILERDPVAGGASAEPGPAAPKPEAKLATAKASPGKKTAAQLRAQQLAARRKASTASKAGGKTVVATRKKAPELVPSLDRVFDGSVFAIVSSGDTMLAATSVGLLTSVDEGVSWGANGPDGSREWRYLAAAKRNVVAASLHELVVSTDSGILWSPIPAPASLTQISALAVEPSGTIWVGGREGVFVSDDRGKSWTTPKNLFLSSVNSIYFDDASDRIMITSNGNATLVFTVQLPERNVSLTDTGWALRFARPMGDYIIAATLFDGIVVQPRMVATPLAESPTPHPSQEVLASTPRKQEP